MVICLEGVFGPPDATATPSALFCYSLAHGLPYWCQLTQVVLKKRLFKQVSLLYKVFMPVLHVVTSQVSHTATDGGATTSAIHCWTPSIRCARPHGLKLLAGRPPRTAGL